MVNPFFERLSLLTGSEAAVALGKCRLIVFGLGGVGSWCAEALVRSGIGNISLVDADKIHESNINRQVQALSGNIGRFKTEVLEERLLQINPSCAVKSFPMVFSKENAGIFDIPGADYVVDAIDTLPHKLDLIETAYASGGRLFSSMGMAQKLDPVLVKTADIWETSDCPLARLVRQGLKKRGFEGHFTAVYSPERPAVGNEAGDSPDDGIDDSLEWQNGKKVIGSCVTVTATAGMVLASLVIRSVMEKCRHG